MLPDRIIILPDSHQSDERTVPHFQHAANCPSISSPHESHFQGGKSSPERASSTMRFASKKSASSTQSCGQHSIGGSSPIPAERNSFFIRHLNPWLFRMFWNMLTSAMFEALYTVFIVSPSNRSCCIPHPAKQKAASHQHPAGGSGFLPISMNPASHVTASSRNIFS